MNISRRQAVQSLGLGGLSLLSPAAVLSAASTRKKLPVAAVVTTYNRNSHADVIVGKILEGWRQQGGPGPDLELVSLYTDQVHKRDLSRGLAEKYGFRIAQTIDEAVTLGQDELPVAGVLSIGEHGDYPHNAVGQRLYPRRRFLDEIVAAMQRCGEFVPIFSDKHLSWNWRDAKHMVDLTKQHGIPFMAGSSLPVCWRYPAQELPLGSEIEDAMVVGYGDLEAYGFHGIEALQCVLERRQGGETGVAAVTALTGDQIWQAEKEKKWDRRLLQSALDTFDGSAERLEERLNPKKTVFYMIEYRDGLRATMAMLNGVSHQYALACRVREQAETFACWFRLEESKPFGHFEHLLRGIEHMIHTQQAAYPVERTLLTTGILDKAMNSMHQQGKRLETPELGIHYPASTWGFANLHEENFPA
ncbi:MAG: hypothetical protein KDA45_08675 [Planctomycetales bacterium]|nr:hypothetical protein [Planctomycetales bacterium]